MVIRPLPAGLRSTTLTNRSTHNNYFKLMVHRGGFEPPYVIDGQIYSLLPLTTRPPVHFCSVCPVKPPVFIRQETTSSRQTPRIEEALDTLKESSGGLRDQNGGSTTKTQSLSTEELNLFQLSELELAKGLEPPTL